MIHGARARTARPAGILWWTVLVGLWMVGCRHLSQEEGLPRAEAPPETVSNLQRFEFTQPQMGVPFRIVLYAADRARAETAANAAFGRISELNDLLSDYDTDSELNRLSRTSGRGEDVEVSDDLWAVLMRAQSLARESGGAFDITVGPVVALWRKARREKAFPKTTLLEDARRRTGFAYVHLDEKRRTARLDQPDMSLDLGGIAKGYAADEAIKVLRAHGIEQALVGGAGDMTVHGTPPGQRAWRIGLSGLEEEPRSPTEFVGLRDAAIATSGDLFQVLELDGRRYSHIVDPRTGIGLTNQSLVTVIAPDGVTADSLATTVSVLGAERGLDFLKRHPGVEARILTRADAGDVRVVETPGFEKYGVK